MIEMVVVPMFLPLAKNRDPDSPPAAGTSGLSGRAQP